jgi:hypothetical protein
VALGPILTARPASAAFLGKRNVIAVSGPQQDGSGNDIYLMGLSGRRVQNLTMGRLSNAVEPTFSPEGGPHIAFVNKPVNGGPGDIVVIDRDSPGSGLSRYVRLPMNNGADDGEPAWSPSGGKIAFTRTVKGGTPTIFTTNLRGELSKTGALDCCKGSGGLHAIHGTEPAWSPDSSQIAYVTPGSTKEIWIASVDGSRREFQLTAGDQPNWSPRGDHITFVRGGSVFVAHLNPMHTGLAATPRLVDDRSHSKTRDQNPAYSPDVGGVVTFDRGDGVIYRVSPGARRPQVSRLSSTSFPRISHADWMPDCNVKARPTVGTVLDERGKGGPLLICGKKGNDTIYGTGKGDRIFGGAGNDIIYAGGGDDFVLGGQGGDHNVIYGGAGSDHLEGGTGPDRIVDTSSGRDVLKGQDGNDMIVANDGKKGNDNVDGGIGTDNCSVDNLPSDYTGDFVWGCESFHKMSAAVAGMFGLKVKP